MAKKIVVPGVRYSDGEESRGRISKLALGMICTITAVTIAVAYIFVAFSSAFLVTAERLH